MIRTLRALPFLATVTLSLMTSSTSFAFETSVCDPSTDPDDCQCPSNLGHHDGCQALQVRDIGTLVWSDDPEELHDALGIQSTYNSKLDVWEVEVDVSDLNTIGLLMTHSNGGHWETTEELKAYIKDLLGIPQSAQYPTTLPPMILSQTGGYAKYNPLEHSFANLTYNHIVLDAISDDDGFIFLDGQQVPLLNGIYTEPSFCGGGQRQRPGRHLLGDPVHGHVQRDSQPPDGVRPLQ